MNEKDKKKLVKELFYKHSITVLHTLTMFNEQFENAIKEYDKAIQVQAPVSPTEPTFTLSEVEDACNIFHNKALIDRLIMGDKIDYKKHFNGVIEIVKERR